MITKHSYSVIYFQSIQQLMNACLEDWEIGDEHEDQTVCDRDGDSMKTAQGAPLDHDEVCISL